ncbi:hypothetical protein ACF05L_01975 [Streptomyces bobili]|uniref:hypothetical protein n=1 Tax=Streptomyces bobili TaxID=67280 RepID=UPI0036F4F353
MNTTSPAVAQVRYGYSHIRTTSFSGDSAWMIYRIRSCEKQHHERADEGVGEKDAGACGGDAGA